MLRQRIRGKPSNVHMAIIMATSTGGHGTDLIIANASMHRPCWSMMMVSIGMAHQLTVDGGALVLTNSMLFAERRTNP
jgi:hypothetical protein